MGETPKWNINLTTFSSALIPNPFMAGHAVEFLRSLQAPKPVEEVQLEPDLPVLLDKVVWESIA